MTGLRWTAAYRLGSQLFSWVVTVLVVRLLTPADYGVMAMAGVATGLAAVFDDLGLGTALVQQKRLRSSLFHRVTGVVIVVAMVLAAGLWLAAGPVAVLLNEPGVIDVIRVTTLAVVCNVIASPFRALLVRYSRFGVIGAIDLGSVVAASITSLVLALLGFGVWALVAANIVSSAFRLVMFTWFSPCRFGIRLDAVGEVLPLARFGAHISLARFFGYLGSHLDKALVGRLLGAVPLGYFSVGSQLARIPVEKGTSMVTQVAYPAFARLSAAEGGGRAQLLKLLSVNTLLFLPVMWVAAALISPVLPVVLGEQWAGIVPIFAIFAAIVPLEMIRSLLQLALTAAGRPDIVMRNAAVTLACVSAGLVLGVQFGLVWAAAGWAIGSIVGWAWIVKQTGDHLGLAAKHIVGVLWKPSIATGAVVMIVVCLIESIDGRDRILWSVAGSIVALASTYALLARIDSETVRTTIRLMSRFVGGK